MSTEIATFLESQSVEAVIASFDVGFDIPFRHDHAVGLLQMLGAFERPKLDASAPSALAVYVGASWCRIVSADVRYRLLDGIETIDSSREQADLLEKLVLACRADCATGLAGDDTRFQAYAVARWLDGAGKIKYRAGNHTEGRMLFERAVKVCRHAGLWWCEPDMLSNFLRSRFEELRVVLEKTVVFQELENSIHETELQCSDRKIGVPAFGTIANSLNVLGCLLYTSPSPRD